MWRNRSSSPREQSSVSVTLAQPAGVRPDSALASSRALAARAVPALGLVAALALGACAPSPKGGGINDPYEKENRAVHRFNVGLDKHLVKPTSNAYGHIVPGPIRQGVSNFASNLSQPSYIVNDLLQANVADGAHTLFRFLVNTTVGIGGIFDPATALGINNEPNDFGHTLHVWGARQGAYLEVPVLGPSTQRDFAGTLVDLAINPMDYLLNGDQRTGGFVVQVFKKLGTRYKYSSTVDSILYGSGDSYAQERLIYLQSRDYQLGIKSKDNAFTDPYEDPYGN